MSERPKIKKLIGATFIFLRNFFSFRAFFGDFGPSFEFYPDFL